MATPTDVRVESRQAGQAILRWTTDGANSIDVYRSPDGVTYAVIGTVVAGTIEFIDTDAAEKTKFWYKLSDDSGGTFSAIVTVVTQLSHSKRQGNSSQLIATTNMDDLSRRLEAKLNGQDVISQPCGLCIVDGAVIIDCTQGCEWFRVIVDQDINSISLLGCDDCPPVDFIVPPNTTRGICGWPVGCDFEGDECFEAPVPGGLHGRTAKTTGQSYNGYGPSPLQSGPCPCPPTTALSIKCCEDDNNCVLDCSTHHSAHVKACGGLGPYKWSSTGNVHLSSTKGNRITISASQGGGGSPTDVAFVTMRATVRRNDNGPCSGDRIDSVGVANNVAGDAPHLCYNCNHELIGPCLPPDGTVTVSGDTCGFGPYNITNGIDAHTSGSRQSTTPLASVEGTFNGVLVTPASQPIPPETGLSGVVLTFVTMFPVGGDTCCDLGSMATVTVTDAAGVSATVVVSA